VITRCVREHQFPSVDKPHAVSFDKSLAPVGVKFVCFWNDISDAGSSWEKVKREGERATIQARERERERERDDK